MIRRSSRRRLLALALGASGLFAAAPVAAQTTRVTLDATAGGGYSSNPFLSSGETGSGYVEASVQPGVSYSDEVGDAGLLAYYRRSEYFRRYNSTDTYGLQLAANRRLSELVSVTSAVSFDSSLLGQNGVGNIVAVDPSAPPPDPTIPDISLLGTRVRQESLNASLGSTWRFSQRDTVTNGFSANKSDYGRVPGLAQQLNSSRTLGANVSYSRTISERTSVGLQASGSWVDYAQPGYSGSFYQPQATYERQLSETIHLSVAAGLIFINSKTALGSENTTGFSGSLNGCRTGVRSNVCLRGYSDGQATGVGDVSRRYGAALDYSYQLAERDILRANAEYSRIESTTSVIDVPTSSFVNLFASAEHSFSQRLFVSLSGAFRTATGFADRPSDVNVRLSIRTRLGDPR